MSLLEVLFRLKKYFSDNLRGDSYILRPNFLIPGASRSGSTTLYYYLKQHPEIFFARIKEPNFFNIIFDLGIEWYLSKFKSSKDYPAIGDATARYYDSEIAAKRLYNFNPNFKLIFILRQPVERIISGYRLAIHRGETSSFEQFTKRYIWSSKYAIHISRLLKYFPRRNMFFIIFEKFINNSHKYLRDVCEFLDISSKFKFDDNKIYQNPSTIPFSLSLQCLNTKLFKSNPKDKENIIKRSSKFAIYELLNFLNCLPNSRKFPEINEKTRMVLNNHFREDISNLEKLIEINLDIWKKEHY